MSREQNCILFFIKSPERGQVKRRLAASLGETVATELYSTFVIDALATLDTCQARVVVCFYPPEGEKSIVAWLGRHHSYLPQRGADLGQRMKNAFFFAFDRGFEQVIIVGSDIPDLPRNIIEDAFESLHSRDAVFGPSFDGGYYLIGFRRDTFQPQAFDGIVWGTETVLQETIDCLRTTGLSLHTLPTWNDIDTLADLKDLFQRHRQTAFSSSQTISYLWGVKSTLDSCTRTEDRHQHSEGKKKMPKMS
jgi:rSAM/selenodomain-associated transferase 1